MTPQPSICTAVAAGKAAQNWPSASAAVFPAIATGDEETVKTEPAGDQKSVVVAADQAADGTSAAERKKQNDARHGRFRRSLQPDPTQRTGQAKRYPPALALKINAADSSQLMEYFQIYGESGEDWAGTETEIEVRETTKGEEQVDGWMVHKSTASCKAR